jgi:hypothetical protein
MNTLDPVTEGGHTCEYIRHPVEWTQNLMDSFSTTRCLQEAVYQTHDTPIRYLCTAHANRKRTPFRRANDIQLQHVALG